MCDTELDLKNYVSYGFICYLFGCRIKDNDPNSRKDLTTNAILKRKNIMQEKSINKNVPRQRSRIRIPPTNITSTNFNIANLINTQPSSSQILIQTKRTTMNMQQVMINLMNRFNECNPHGNVSLSCNNLNLNACLSSQNNTGISDPKYFKAAEGTQDQY